MAEIAKFNALAERWWDENGPMRPLHRINPLRLGWMRGHMLAHFERVNSAREAFSGLRLLDVGCGGGLVSEPFARQGFDVTGLDLAEKNIAAARIHAAQSGVQVAYRVCAIEQMPEAPSFDVITLLEVVEHVPDMPEMIRQCALRLKPGGLLVASTINRTLKAHLLAIIGAEYILRWLPKGTHQWEKFVTPVELGRAFEGAGLAETARSGMVFNPLFNQWKMSPDMDVNYYMVARKPQ